MSGVLDRGGPSPAPVSSRVIRRRRRVALAGVAVLGVSATFAVVRSRPTSAAPSVVASSTSCAVHGEWRAGAQSVRVRNVGSQVAYVHVAGIGDRESTVYGDVENVGPGSEAEMVVTVDAGPYQVWCITGLSGNGHAAPVVVGYAKPGPVALPRPRVWTTADEFTAPFEQYRAYVTDAVGSLGAALVELRSASVAGDGAAARRAYVVAHGHYGRIGAAYGAFGELGDTIDGVGATTGFHRIEALLWAAPPDTAGAVAAVDALAADVATLRTQAADLELDPVGYSVRAHEILEDALHQAVTGLAEPYSHTGIDDVVAAARGTRFVLGTLQPLVERADAARWRSIGARLDRLERVLDGLATADGTHVRDDALTDRQRAALTSALDGALEELAWLPGLIAPSGGS